MKLLASYFAVSALLLFGCDRSAIDETSASEPTSAKQTRPLRIPSIIEDETPEDSVDPSSVGKKKLPLSQYWLRALDAAQLRPRLQRVSTRTRARIRGTNLDRRIELSFSDTSSAEATRRMLTALELPQIDRGLTGQVVRWKDRSWHLALDDESTLKVLTWSRAPVANMDPTKRCPRPHHLEGAEMLSGGIKQTFEKRTTKRIIEIEELVDLKGATTELLVWYKNGFAQDEHIGQLQTALRSQKWHQVAGTSVKQQWIKEGSGRLSWHPVREPFTMNCTLRGALVRYAWSR